MAKRPSRANHFDERVVPEVDPIPILSVGEVASAIREVVETTFPLVRVCGEVSNLSRPQSGHVYFSLVDEVEGSRGRLGSSQLPCVIWRSTAARLRLQLEGGQRVIASGRVTVYEPRGTYQLIVDRIEAVGKGDLHARFEELKERLRVEGLFDAERKRPLPAFPRRIGLVTSTSGAAVQDVLRSILRRDPGASVRIVPARVQGEGAAEEIAAAVRLLHEATAGVDVIVLARGGGSLEDLWAFNEEIVARSIAASSIPIVSAVGHEVDFTIADFAADCRAQTPTQAGELVCPDRVALSVQSDVLGTRLHTAVHRALERARAEVERLRQSAPFRVPETFVQRLFERCDECSRLLEFHLYNRFQQWDDTVAFLTGKLEALSPLNVLARGYAVAMDREGHAILDAADLQLGQEIRIRFSRGGARAEVLGPDEDLEDPDSHET